MLGKQTASRAAGQLCGDAAEEERSSMCTGASGLLCTPSRVGLFLLKSEERSATVHASHGGAELINGGRKSKYKLS